MAIPKEMGTMIPFDSFKKKVNIQMLVGQIQILSE